MEASPDSDTLQESSICDRRTYFLFRLNKFGCYHFEFFSLSVYFVHNTDNHNFAVKFQDHFHFLFQLLMNDL